MALAFYKYASFGIDILNHILGTSIGPANIVLSLGISFFTFTQISYLADVFEGYPSERNFAKYALFVSYFPHLIAGPILHHREMMPQFGAPASRHFSAERTSIGLTIFAIGLFKKAIIADGFALIVNPIFQAASKGSIAAIDGWGGALAYSLQIYFDFSGYCDMATGLSLLFGIVLPFNFDAPYKAQSIVEFWRRWQITLSPFLRDYLYIALGGNRHGGACRNANLLATMLLGGLWHGAGWTFLIWGGLHGAYLIINHLWIGVIRRGPMLSRWTGTVPYAIGALLLTQIAVVVAWVFFRADGLSTARRILAAMLGGTNKVADRQPSLVDASQLGFIAIGYLICLSLPNVARGAEQTWPRRRPYRGRQPRTSGPNGDHIARQVTSIRRATKRLGGEKLFRNLTLALDFGAVFLAMAFILRRPAGGQLLSSLLSGARTRLSPDQELNCYGEN